jgi:UDP-hydrolysing UDP-N-acetyl-D-glucosamine 2-epimerase
MKKTIAVVTSSRADYSHLYWPLRDLAAHPELDLRLIAMGPHLSPEYGLTAGEIEKDGFRIDARVECLLSSDTDVAMAKTIGVAALGLADVLGRMRPDILLLIADRYEMLAPASVALALRLPIAHIEGGEISEGAIDDAVRNALTQMSHLHFTSTETARRRVIAMGEEEWRVHRAGAPSLDHLRRRQLLTRAELESKLALDLSRPPMVVSYHPVTLLADTTAEAGEFFKALAALSGPMVFCYPNADAGSHALIERARSFLAARLEGRLFVNFDAVTYWSLLRQAALMLGNSSSGIMETASFALPTVNVGLRQKGREHGPNVLHAEARAEAIIEKVREAGSEAFRKSLAGMANPYGDGRASERIVQVLAAAPPAPVLLMKKHAAESSKSIAARSEKAGQ